ncbi:MAG: hypothetical protein ACFFE4_06670 [Candidatus Thorarchaeota archaeon]
MTYSTSQDSLELGKNSINKYLNILKKTIKILENFETRYEKRLNVSKLAQNLNLTSSEIDTVLTTLLTFQDLFTNTFKHYIIKRKIIDNEIFLITSPKLNSGIPKKIKLSYNDYNLLSDIIYIFKFVKRGNGFNVAANGTELISNIKDLWNYHPYLFEEFENGLTYPSEFGLKLGELILSYKKSGKVIEEISVNNHIIMVS